ncbi:hypothetical protein EV13_2519 [Prochlorococcus sp. MIT 0702]|nr:hypothetical protein EV12_2306 [Prochlorococcus sp. MIT 0701]KGG26385.1 hypothetical protein EV13_2519 [Prochlorococcus sp. MIT 0702]KGG31195.1 hypothetical protein EV14_2566 [Prochlorococcus sp. MIT 0703]
MAQFVVGPLFPFARVVLVVASAWVILGGLTNGWSGDRSEFYG